MDNYGKKFEQKFKQDWLKVEGSTIDRLYDPSAQYLGIRNICDFIGYIYPNIYYLECKTHKGASLPFECITQYDRLVEKIGIKGIRAGIVLWLYEKDIGVIYIPIQTIKEMKEDGLKSFGVKHLDSKYKSIVLPSKKLRTFYDTDYSPLTQLTDD